MFYIRSGCYSYSKYLAYRVYNTKGCFVSGKTEGQDRLTRTEENKRGKKDDKATRLQRCTEGSITLKVGVETLKTTEHHTKGLHCQGQFHYFSVQSSFTICQA